jgi:hypothetical protein
MPDDVYNKYSIRSEYSLFVEFEDSKKSCESQGWRVFRPHKYSRVPSDDKTSNLSIDLKTWFLFIPVFWFKILDEFAQYLTFICRSCIYSPSNQTLGLEMFMHSSDKSKTIAELIFWYWGDKDIVIIKVGV